MTASNSDSSSKSQLNYKTAGVDIEAGDALVDWLQTDKRKMPHSERLISGIGGFASLFDISFPEMKKPCLITCTDGVGTKVKLASYFKRFDTVGQDLVAMCVNDLICSGGMPLLFLDYYATGKLHLPWAQEFLSGVKNACLEANCLLAGGETAEMPGVYSSDDFDCAGFSVGVVDYEKRIGPHLVQAGDIVIGVGSSGFHSNGYSLVRKVFEKDLEQFKDLLLTPTHLYVKLMKQLQGGNKVKLAAAANITGGGIENIPRVLPDQLAWKARRWKLPEPFTLVQKRTQMSEGDLLRTLNCGIGFVLILSATQVQQALKVIHECGFTSYELGEVEVRSGESPFQGELAGV